MVVFFFPKQQEEDLKPSITSYIAVSGGFMCILSLVCALALGFFDKRADRILKRSAVSSGNL